MPKSVYIRLSSIEIMGLVRLGGPGLGNILLTIAHGIRIATEQNCPIIHPVIPQIKIGPWLRGEKQKRFYFGELKYNPLLTMFQQLRAYGNSHDVIEATGLYDYFIGIEEHKSVIKNWLLINSTKSINSHHPVFDIGIHVRRGDFSKTPTKNGINEQLTIDWYIAAIEIAIKRSEEHTCSILVSSDDNGEACNTIRNHFGSTAKIYENKNKKIMSSIYGLASARQLIISRSTLSLWSVFLAGKNQRIIADADFDYSAQMVTRNYDFTYF